MQYFNPEEYVKLEAELKRKALAGDPDAADDINLVKQAAMSLASYVLKVSEERIEVRFAHGFLKGDEYRNIIQHYDGARHDAHEIAIVNTRKLNRVASFYGVDKIFLGDTENRREIGEFCLEFTSWLFANRYF